MDKLRASLKKKNESIEEVDPDILRQVKITEAMLLWRDAAKAHELTLSDPGYIAHHSGRTAKSIRGPYRKPATSTIPDLPPISNTTLSQNRDDLIQILNLTACNWAGFHNKASLVLKYVKFVLASLDIRTQLYVGNIFDKPEIHPVFLEVISALSITLPNKPLWKLFQLPSLKGKQPAINPMDSLILDQSILHEQEINTALLNLQTLVRQHGKVNHLMPKRIVSAFTDLTLVCCFSFCDSYAYSFGFKRVW